jgi:hypothetical protein
VLIEMAYALVSMTCVGEHNLYIGEYNICVGEYDMCWSE